MSDINKSDQNKQKRITVNFRLLSEEEQKLYEWVKENGAVGGDSAFIKSLLYKEYKERTKGK
ncbi:hypothetical protein [Clostridium sardiniense]|uniref:hypothetical protein n=1 Tax=Clostridium sardiniense TaxID=29369 RepID=UPI00195EBC56|nr:hypothetical protein [Clostridium sardiniense]MBM7834999.1 hypothetical protein [Clostridium sardiniense]